MKKVAYVFEDVGGWYFCDDNDELNTFGEAYTRKTSAIRGASSCGYTHYKCGNVVKKISKRDHELNWATG